MSLNGTYWMADFSYLYKFLFQLSLFSDSYKVDVERDIEIKYVYANAKRKRLLLYDAVLRVWIAVRYRSCIVKTMLRFENWQRPDFVVCKQ